MKTSVVIAAKNASSVIHESLTAWKNQLHTTDEIIVVHASDDSTVEIVKRQFPVAKLLELEKSALIPELWSAGIQQATGELTVVTIANCVPRSAWIKHARILIASGLSAAAGAVENHREASITDTAVYFCRYWRYMPPFIARETDDLPGDNVIYKSSDLLMYRRSFLDGFWEAEINKQMKADGLHLMLTSDLTASHKYGAGFFRFLGNRLRHGIHFARERSSSLGFGNRMLYSLAFPLIPFILFRRILNATKKDLRQKRALKRSSILVFLFLIAWAIGEACGYIAGPLKR
jgi:glycosyltransferase involved in cell wall biosynthesis